MRNWVRLLIMFGPVIMRQFQKWKRSRPKAITPPRPEKRKKEKYEPQTEELEEVIYTEELPEEDEFVDPINN